MHRVVHSVAMSFVFSHIALSSENNDVAVLFLNTVTAPRVTLSASPSCVSIGNH
jgi:hypothetical protein